MGSPNYEACSLSELLDVERNIDREKYPDRYQEVLRQIRLKREQGELEYDSPFQTGADEIPASPFFRYQTFWRRFWALVVDSLVLIPLLLLHHWIVSTELEGFPLFFWILVSSAAQVLYFILMHAAYGQTIGKMVTRVIVVDVSESKLRFRQAVLRDIVPIAFWLLNIHWAYLAAYHGLSDQDVAAQWIHQAASYGLSAWAILELVTMLLNRKRRALHDFIAGSVVVKKPDEFPGRP